MTHILHGAYVTMVECIYKVLVTEEETEELFTEVFGRLGFKWIKYPLSPSRVVHVKAIYAYSDNSLKHCSCNRNEPGEYFYEHKGEHVTLSQLLKRAGES